MFEANARTLTELSVSLTACYSLMDLEILLKTISSQSSTSILSRISLTAAPDFDNDGDSIVVKKEAERRKNICQLSLSLSFPSSLIDVSINGFSIEDRIDLIRIFSGHAHYLQSLIVHPVIPRVSSGIENELDDIKNLFTHSLRTFIY